MRPRLAVGAAIMVAIAGCSSSDDTVAVDTTPALSARIDGVTWTAATLSATFAAGYLSVTAAVPGQGTLTFSLIANARGSYDLSTSNAMTSTYTFLSSTWTASGVNGVGNVTITSFSSNSASGTFSFTLPAVSGTAATGSKVINSGTFTVNF